MTIKNIGNKHTYNDDDDDSNDDDDSDDDDDDSDDDDDNNVTKLGAPITDMINTKNIMTTKFKNTTY